MMVVHGVPGIPEERNIIIQHHLITKVSARSATLLEDIPTIWVVGHNQTHDSPILVYLTLEVLVLQDVMIIPLSCK